MPTVPLCFPPTCKSGQLGVKGALNAADAGLLVIVGHETQNVRGQALAGVVADLVVLWEDRLGSEISVKGAGARLEFRFIDGEGQRRHGLPDFFPYFQRHFAFEDDVFGNIGLAVFLPHPRNQTLGQGGFIGLKQWGQHVRHVLAVRADEGRIGANYFGGLAVGQGSAVDVQDLAAHGLPLDGADGVLLGQRLEFLVADDL